MKIGDFVYMNKCILGIYETNVECKVIDTWGSGFEVMELKTTYIYRCFRDELSYYFTQSYEIY